MAAQLRMNSITLAFAFACLLLGTSNAAYLRQDRSTNNNIIGIALDKYNNERTRNITCVGDIPSGHDCEELYLGLPSTSSKESSSGQRIALEDGQDRVSRLDHNDLYCKAGRDEDTNDEIVIEFLKYYYAVETDIGAKKGFINTIERKLFLAISADLLWCYKKNTPTVDIRDGGDGGRHQRKLLDTELGAVHNHPTFSAFTASRRSLSKEEARQLALISVNTAPMDEEVEGLTCNYDYADEQCEVFEGHMSVVANGGDWIGHMRASLFDAIQDSMDKDILLGKDISHVSKIVWLGTTMKDAKAGGPLGGAGGLGAGAGAGAGGIGGDGDSDGTQDRNVDTSNADITSDGDFRLRTVFAVSIPLLLLMLLGFLLAKKNGRDKNRQALTVGQAAALASKNDGQRKVYGTGDPPRSFHEGLYHYTRGGARYLSTCCPDCIETRRRGYFLDDHLHDNGDYLDGTDGHLGRDLATIGEGQLYDPASGLPRSRSCGDLSMATDSSESTNGIRLVSPNSKDLGGRHSSIDVHNCASATCAICKRRAEEITFLSSPAIAQRARSYPAVPVTRMYFPDSVSDDSSDTRSLS